jgi:hypothetical protein
MSRSGLGQSILRVFVAAAVAASVSRLLCLFTAPSESRSVLLTAFSGTCGGCLGGLSPGWKGARLVSNAITGIALSLALYYCMRGLIVRAIAPPSTLRACGIATVAFLTSMSRTPDETWNQTNLIAGRAITLLIVSFLIRGIAFLCQ